MPTRRRSLLLPAILGVVALAAIGGAVLLSGLVQDEPADSTDALYAAGTAGSDSTPQDVSDATGTPPSILAGSATPRATVAPEDAVLLAQPRHIRIDRLGVDADLVTLGIDTSTGNMADPDGPELVGWYDFTGKPGGGTGNAVFAGHRDWRNYGPAVFYDLATLEPGDTIEVELADGSLVRYSVTATHSYPVAELDMREILARTEEETLTLITCAGTFEAGDYSDRHIVRAVRSDAIPSAAAAMP